MKTGSKMIVMVLGALGATGITMAQCGSGYGPGNGRRGAQSCAQQQQQQQQQQQRAPQRWQQRDRQCEQQCGQQCGQPCTRQCEQPQTPARKPALGDALVTQLQGTLADEYLARDVYRAAAARFGRRQFTNHARAEEHHIAALSATLRNAGADPVTTAGRSIELPATLPATEQLIAELEANMIRAYQQLLTLGEHTALVPMLQNIQAANRRHLQAATGGDGGQTDGDRNRRPDRRQGRGTGQCRGVDCGQQCAPASRSCRR